MASTPNVGTVNVRSWGNKKELVCNLLASESVGILAIQETLSTPHRQMKIPQYQTYQKHSEQRSWGVALAISHRLPSRPLAIPPEHALQNVVAATVIWQGKTVNIYSICIRPHDRLPISFLRYASQNPPAIVVGDLNARHADFGDHATNTNGRNLQLALDTYPILRLGCTEPTLINHNGHSIIDHIILTEDLVDDLLPDATIGAPVASDHLPVVGKAALPRFPLPEAEPCQMGRMRAWSYAKWDELVAQVQRATDRRQEPIATTQELEHRVSELTDIVETAIEANVPTRNFTPRPPALPPDIMHLVREKRRLYRTLKRTNDPVIRTTWNRLVAITRRKIREHREKEWRNITATLDYRDGKKFWNLLNRLTGRKAAPKYPLQAGIKPLTDAEKSEVFASALLESSRLEDQLFDEPFREAVTEEINNLRLADSHPPVNEPITAEEIAETIAGQKKNSAPGKDGISETIIRKLPESAIEWLRQIYNACLTQGHFPRPWKAATVLMFGKPGKDPTLPSSYRPISLLPVI
ncbi:PREDICTED: RNA-directed DNA polymerase from mobile element jockey-like, partial [Nicrophorus vespilloides]|uniref:RNA-directed DNA polymerase from mobile element jockey-like n=1 Tax=Nicrophorus vespilloides TaxID=110193 RepID=A0ABM1MTM2_NICVS